MTDKSPGQLSCPISRYLTAITDRSLREYADADSLPDKERTLRNALDMARVFEQAIRPLANDAGREDLADVARTEASRLMDLARPWVEKHPANFPKVTDRTLQILDMIEGVEDSIRHIRADLDRLLTRKKARAAAQPRKEAA